MTGWAGYHVSVEEAERRYEHGTAARYHLAKCRCLPCCVAQSETYRRLNPLPIWRMWRASTGTYVVKNVETSEVVARGLDRDAAVALRVELNDRDMETPLTRMVDVDEVRRHVRFLARHGVGMRAVSRATGIRYETVRRIAGRATPEIRRTRVATAEKILAVTVSDRADGVPVDAAETWALIECLLRAGWTKGRVAIALGNRQPALQIRGDVTTRTARKVRELHDAVVARDPDAALACSHRKHGHDRKAAERKRLRDLARERAS